jgi:hypothetical protein
MATFGGREVFGGARLSEVRKPVLFDPQEYRLRGAMFARTASDLARKEAALWSLRGSGPAPLVDGCGADLGRAEFDRCVAVGRIKVAQNGLVWREFDVFFVPVGGEPAGTGDGGP